MTFRYIHTLYVVTYSLNSLVIFLEQFCHPLTNELDHCAAVDRDPMLFVITETGLPLARAHLACFVSGPPLGTLLVNLIFIEAFEGIGLIGLRPFFAHLAEKAGHHFEVVSGETGLALWGHLDVAQPTFNYVIKLRVIKIRSILL